MIGVSTLLKSCAMPDANWPTASIFWLCANCTSSALLSVLSTANTTAVSSSAANLVKVKSTERGISASTVASTLCRLPSPASAAASACCNRMRSAGMMAADNAAPRLALSDRSMKAAFAMRIKPSLSTSAMPSGALLMKRDSRGAEISARPPEPPASARGTTSVRDGDGVPSAVKSTWWITCTGTSAPVVAFRKSRLKLSVTAPPGLASTPEICRAPLSPSMLCRFRASPAATSIPSHCASVALR